MSNRVYQDRVAQLEGTQDFLIAAGFKIMKLPYQDGEEDFWVFSEGNLDSSETLHVSMSMLFLKTLRFIAALKMEAVGSSEMLVTIHKAVLYYGV